MVLAGFDPRALSIILSNEQLRIRFEMGSKEDSGGSDYRDLVVRAVRHLGHGGGNISNKLAEKVLGPFLSGRRPRSERELRLWLMAAARMALKVSRDPVREKAARGGPDGFYASWEWKAVRYEALKVHGHRCQCCGWRPGDTEAGRLVVDHIRPRRKYPALALDLRNLQVLCNDCNMGKSDVHVDDFRSNNAEFAAMIRDLIGQ